MLDDFFSKISGITTMPRRIGPDVDIFASFRASRAGGRSYYYFIGRHISALSLRYCCAFTLLFTTLMTITLRRRLQCATKRLFNTHYLIVSISFEHMNGCFSYHFFEESLL